MSTGERGKVGCAVWLILAGDLLVIPAVAAVLRHLLGPGPLSAVTIIIAVLVLLAAGPVLLGHLDARDERRRGRAGPRDRGGAPPGAAG
ncbi:hypothetical protein HS048_21315 [Planomonospora sp. ID91781]|uniref:Uncharacterized protein n=1 Tax=Planomonospora sphaerica TaxID=161355 RepID=A0A171DQG1_9ACTN|nr:MULTISPECIES: hypothetical protein [Planomonospora]MBG0823274.1 hypothetical protein [Planomonospora sp. ID91781]GAT71302.1 hypothetical protein PS9374_06993 [Planomonospora sphaerica]